MECMDSILRVVTVNFKVQIAPGVIQDIKGHMYTSLLHSSPPTRANIMLGGGLDSRPGTSNSLTGMHGRMCMEHRCPHTRHDLHVYHLMCIQELGY